LADGPHAEPPWLFLLGWYPSGFMMQHKDNEISVDWLSEIVSRKERKERKMHWKRGRAKNAGNAKCTGKVVAQSTQSTQIELEGVSRKAHRERKV